MLTGESTIYDLIEEYKNRIEKEQSNKILHPGTINGKLLKEIENMKEKQPPIFQNFKVDGYGELVVAFKELRDKQ